MLTHAWLDAIVAYRAGEGVTVGTFLADVRRVARTLPAAEHVVNVCSDRYHFTVGLAASLSCSKLSLLPPTHTAEVIRQLAAFAPDVFCLTDEEDCDVELPQVLYPQAAATVAGDHDGFSLELDLEQTVAYVFTSGSTGTPVPHRKTWGCLARCVRAEAQRMGILDGRAHALLATVPPQHMYGFESSVLAALQSGNALCAERPFYPADICAALAALPEPRVLITTPIHLRALLQDAIRLPLTERIVSATAPLSQEVAVEVERRYETQLLEIYGSTETGQIASRRTADTLEWRLWPGVRLESVDGRTWAHGGHVAERTALWDVIEPTGAESFLLHGRLSDLVNIGGKRSSLAYLTHQLLDIPGVADGAFFHLSEDSREAIARVAAAVVAPGMAASTLIEELRRRIDPVFVPRPLLLLERLPRNSTGKLPYEALRALAAQHLRGRDQD